jgi:hypothetical protein
MAMTFNTYARNNETRKYVKRIKNAGKTLDAFSVLDIDNFVTGCKDLGVWNNMVCWPLRSTQNTGTNTAFSLGGLGTFDGTLVNGPTWGLNGVTFNSSNSTVISTTLFRSSLPLTLTMIANFTGKNGGGVDDYPNGFIFPANGGASLGANYLGTAFGVNRLYVSDDFTVPITFGNYFFESATLTTSTVEVWLNGSTNNGSWTASGWSNVGLTFGGAGGQYFNGIISLGIFTDELWTSTQKSSLYNLYKTTLGRGLGLP